MKKFSILSHQGNKVNVILRFQLNQLRISIIKKLTDTGEDEVKNGSKILE